MLPIEGFLKQCYQMGGSDLHVKTDTGKIYVRRNGELEQLEGVPHFTEAEFLLAMEKVLRPAQMEKFNDTFELDFALEVPGVSRFRGNLFKQRNTSQAIFRVIPFEIQGIDDLQLPELCRDLLKMPRGLILVTGPAGSGKSTTLAAMIDEINRNQPVHIMTVEDPVEFVHDDHVALINQREIDVDTMSFANALKYVLRQDPDVILVGEMRDLETVHLAITAAETGHLVFGTLHTVDALQTVDRIVDVFPQHQQQQIRMQLSVNLLGVISQTLIPRKDNRGRIAAFEVLNCTSAVRNLIRENKSYQISSIMQTGARFKMQTLDQGLAKLVERGLVDIEVAKFRAKDPSEFMRIVSSGKKPMPTAPTKPAPSQPGQPVVPQQQRPVVNQEPAKPAPQVQIAPTPAPQPVAEVKPEPVKIETLPPAAKVEPAPEILDIQREDAKVDASQPVIEIKRDDSLLASPPKAPTPVEAPKPQEQPAAQKPAPQPVQPAPQPQPVQPAPQPVQQPQQPAASAAEEKQPAYQSGAARRVLPGQMKPAEQPSRNDDVLLEPPAPRQPAAQAQPQVVRQDPVLKPTEAPMRSLDPILKPIDPPTKKIDPPGRKPDPEIDQPKKKGFFASIFGSKD